MSTLVIAEHDHQTLRAATRSAIAAAAKLGDAIEVLVAGYEVADIAQHTARLARVKRVRVVDDARSTHPLAADFAPLIVEIAHDYTATIAAATSFGKTLLPR